MYGAVDLDILRHIDVKAVLSQGSEDYMKMYGWNIERALIFTSVNGSMFFCSTEIRKN